jgi:hypothetical protein
LISIQAAPVVEKVALVRVVYRLPILEIHSFEQEKEMLVLK